MNEALFSVGLFGLCQRFLWHLLSKFLLFFLRTLQSVSETNGDLFFFGFVSARSLSQDRSSPSPWTDLLAHPHKHKELAHYCSLLQEHYHQSYVKGNSPPGRLREGFFISP